MSRCNRETALHRNTSWPICSSIDRNRLGPLCSGIDCIAIYCNCSGTWCDDTRWPPLLIPYFLFTHRTHQWYQWYPTMHCNTSQHPRWSLVPYNSWQCPLWYLTIPSPIPAILASCFALELWEVRIDSRPAGGGRSSLRSQIQTPGCRF